MAPVTSRRTLRKSERRNRHKAPCSVRQRPIGTHNSRFRSGFPEKKCRGAGEIPKIEGRNPSERKNLLDRFSAFGLLSAFGFRPSDFLCCQDEKLLGILRLRLIFP